MPIIEARGLKHFMKYLRVVGDVQLPAEWKLVNLAIAQGLADEIKSAAPVGTRAEGDPHPGALAAATKAFATPTTARVQIGKGLKYTKPIIFGWKRHNIAANRYPYPIVDSRRADIIEKYRVALDVALKDHV